MSYSFLANMPVFHNRLRFLMLIQMVFRFFLLSLPAFIKAQMWRIPLAMIEEARQKNKEEATWQYGTKPHLSVLESGSSCHYSCLCGTSIQCCLYQTLHFSVYPKLQILPTFTSAYHMLEPIKSFSVIPFLPSCPLSAACAIFIRASPHPTPQVNSYQFRMTFVSSLPTKFQAPETWPLLWSVLVTPVLHSFHKLLLSPPCMIRWCKG